MSEVAVKMSVADKMEHGRQQKEYLIKLILEYQKGGLHTLDSLRGKTLKQLERICEKEGI